MRTTEPEKDVGLLPVLTVFGGDDSAYSVHISVLVLSTALNERVEINSKLFL